jgi:hypothetical protein
MQFTPSEDQEQISLIQWASYNPDIFPYIIHIPNGGSRHPLEALKLKKMGVKKGVSDLFFTFPVFPYCGLWIELKSRKKGAKATEEQIQWLQLMNKVGYKAVLCHGWEEARDQIINYLK